MFIESQKERREGTIEKLNIINNNNNNNNSSSSSSSSSSSNNSNNKTIYLSTRKKVPLVKTLTKGWGFSQKNSLGSTALLLLSHFSLTAVLGGRV
jgi:hypothetical protein